MEEVKNKIKNIVKEYEFKNKVPLGVMMFKIFAVLDNCEEQEKTKLQQIREYCENKVIPESENCCEQAYIGGCNAIMKYILSILDNKEE